MCVYLRGGMSPSLRTAPELDTDSDPHGAKSRGSRGGVSRKASTFPHLECIFTRPSYSPYDVIHETEGAAERWRNQHLHPISRDTLL